MKMASSSGRLEFGGWCRASGRNFIGAFEPAPQSDLGVAPYPVLSPLDRGGARGAECLPRDGPTLISGDQFA